MKTEQIEAIKRAEKHLQDAAAILKGVAVSMPTRGPGNAWREDLLHWASEVSTLLVSDEGECGLSVCIPKMQGDYRTA